MRISDWSSDVCSSDLISTGSVRPISSTSGEDPSGEADNWKRNCALGASGARQRKRYCRYRPARRSSRLVLIRLSLRRSEEHTSELQSLMRISYAVFCLTKKIQNTH